MVCQFSDTAVLLTYTSMAWNTLSRSFGFTVTSCGKHVRNVKEDKLSNLQDQCNKTSKIRKYREIFSAAGKAQPKTFRTNAYQKVESVDVKD